MIGSLAIVGPSMGLGLGMTVAPVAPEDTTPWYKVSYLGNLFRGRAYQDKSLMPLQFVEPLTFQPYAYVRFTDSLSESSDFADGSTIISHAYQPYSGWVGGPLSARNRPTVIYIKSESGDLYYDYGTYDIGPGGINYESTFNDLYKSAYYVRVVTLGNTAGNATTIELFILSQNLQPQYFTDAPNAAGSGVDLNIIVDWDDGNTDTVTKIWKNPPYFDKDNGLFVLDYPASASVLSEQKGSRKPWQNTALKGPNDCDFSSLYATSGPFSPTITIKAKKQDGTLLDVWLQLPGPIRYTIPGAGPPPRPTLGLSLINNGDNSGANPTIVQLVFSAGTADYFQVFADWGDSGNVSVAPLNLDWPGPFTLAYSYASPGTFNVVPTVYDSSGNLVPISPSTISVDVAAAVAPAVSLVNYNNGDISGSNPTQVQFTCTNDGSINDPGQFPIDYSIDWGDGLGIPSTGDWPSGSSLLVVGYTYGAAGTYTVTPTLTPAIGPAVVLTPTTVSVSPVYGVTPTCTLTDTNDGDVSGTDPTAVTIACTNAGSLGPTQIPFAYSINWGDSSSPSTGSWDPTAGNLVPHPQLHCGGYVHRDADPDAGGRRDGQPDAGDGERVADLDANVHVGRHERWR